jgi:hypothetical protein
LRRRFRRSDRHVFFICTAGFDGGSGKTVIRAVSFFGETGVGIGAGMAAAAARGEEAGSIGAAGGFAGGRVGRWILTVSRDTLLAAGGISGWGVTVMRTVSFLGSFESAMRGRTSKYDVASRRRFCHSRSFIFR